MADDDLLGFEDEAEGFGVPAIPAPDPFRSHRERKGLAAPVDWGLNDRPAAAPQRAPRETRPQEVDWGLDDKPAGLIENPPMPRPRPAAAPPPATAAPAAIPESPPDTKTPGPDDHFSVTRGFVTGLLKSNPDLAGEAMEGLSHLAPDSFRDALVSGSKTLKDAAKLSPKEYEPRIRSMWDIGSFGDALTWAGETIGQGVASTVPSIATGLGGALLGGRVGGKVGAAGGALAGAAAPSFVLNYGDVYQALKAEKVDPKTASEYALYASGPMVALDTLSVGPIISQLGGLNEVKRQVARGIARRIAAEGAKGFGREGITEAAQQAVQEATVSLASDKPFWTIDTAKDVVQAGVAGALAGGAMGGAAGIRPDAPINRPSPQSSPEEIEAFLRRATEQAPQPQAEAEPAVTPAAPPSPLPELPAPSAPTAAAEAPKRRPAPGPEPAPAAAVPPADAAILRAYGYTDEQILDMSDAQRAAEVAEAREAGTVAEPAPAAEIDWGLDDRPAEPPVPPEQQSVPASPSAEEDTLADSTGLRSMGGNMAAGMVDRMYDMLWSKVEAGDTKEHGKVNPLLQAAKIVRAAGGLRERAEFVALAQDFASNVVSGRPTFQADMRALVQRHVPATPPSSTAIEDFGAEDRAVGTRAAPLEPASAAEIDATAALVNAEPTEAQKEAGNYQKQHIRWNGLDISVENPKGSTRSGKSPDGTEWSVTMPAHYGYLKRSRGADGDQIDVYIGNHLDAAAPVYVIDQNDLSGKFDEHKVVLGVPSETAARDLYARGFSDGKGAQRLGAITQMTPEEFKAWLREGDTTKPIVSTREVKAPAPPRGEPMSLLQFIASRGGVKPDPELDVMDLTGSHRVQVPGRRGFFGVVRPGGMNLDRMREAAQEAGYFPKDDPNAPPTNSVRDFLDAIDAEMRGERRYPEGFEGYVPRAEQRRAAERAEDETAEYQARVADNRKAINQMLADFGMPPVANEEDLDLAAEIMERKGLEPDDALERAAMRNVAAIEESSDQPVTPDVINDIYDWGAIDAVQPEPALEDVAAPAPEGEGSEGPRAEGGPAQPGDDISRLGEDRGGPVQGEAREEAERTEPTTGRGPSPDQRVATETTAAGEQTVLPGAERIGDGELAQRKSDQPLKPTAAQKPADEGLFGDDSKQTDLLDVKPQPAEAKKPKPKKAKQPSFVDRMENYFRPGRIVDSYSGKDRVISFERLPGDRWQVEVVETKDGKDVGRHRRHESAPGRRDLERWEKDNPVGSFSQTDITQARESGPSDSEPKFKIGDIVERAPGSKLGEAIRGRVTKVVVGNGFVNIGIDNRGPFSETDFVPVPSPKDLTPEQLEQEIERISEELEASPKDRFLKDRLSRLLEQNSQRLDDMMKGRKRPSTLTDVFIEHLRARNGFKGILEARKMAKEAGYSVDAKQVEEALEFAVVQVAKGYADNTKHGVPYRKPSVIFQNLVDLYQRQPKLGTRTSTSMRDQAFSTPVPLAYLASRLAGIKRADVVFEPTAGNGALLIEARPEQTVIANEINPDRAANLKSQGFNVTSQDAAKPSQAQAVKAAYGGADVVIANPPFGAMKEDGASHVFNLSDIQKGYRTTQIDHVIALRALSVMRDDGRAALIVGGLKKTKTTREARSDGYNAKDKREFYKTLYDRYNVVDHFTVAGELYERQGAGWPVDVVVIDGRGKSSRALPAVDVPRVYTSWDELGGLLHEDAVSENARAPRGQDGAIDPSDATRGTGVADGRVHPPVGGRRVSDRVAAANDTAGVRPGPAPDQHGDRIVDGVGRQDEVQPGGGRDAGRPDPAHAAQRRAPRVEQETERQVAYKPRSGKTESLGTLVPVNMRTSLQESLDRVEARVGDLDTFVARELGYTPDELTKYFGSEQVDALALAIDNVKRGKGFIIGDQTGIGKGRVNAAVIRWAIKNGRIPVFVTERPNLYGDMYRDLQDIGISDDFLDGPPRILATNAAANVPLTDDGSVVLRTGDAKQHNAHLQSLDPSNFAQHYDMVFTNYSQMQTVRGDTTARRDFLSRIIPNAVLIFDESHNAGGQDQSRKPKGAKADRAGFARDLVSRADGVFYSSATYAKRPDVMDLYAATDMSMAVPNPSDLGEAIDKGGVPMQQVVATMLAQAGQYVRRERSFAGIKYDTPIVPVNREAYDGISRALSQIQKFSEHVKTISDKIDEDMKAIAGGVAFDNATGDAGSKSVAFTSIMHNIINQLLLAMKAKGASERAIQAIKDGKKPVITLANTMESFLKNYADDIGISHRGVLEADFGDVLVRYLERTRTLLIKKPYSQETERRYLSDGDLGKAGVALYNQTKAHIQNLDLSDLPVSPIDAIKSEIEKAGFSVGEITGRGTIVDYSGPEPILKARPGRETSIRGRRETIAAFNSGDLDAVILNQAGATGLSLHASEKFKDQRQRKMIIAQAEGNIDTHMQMLGRVHRTGQVVVPEYDQLVADIPAEKRPAAVLAKKMASLNANTTASRGGALTAKDVPDFINQYGDMVAASYIAENPEMNRRLGDPVKFKDNGGIEIGDVMRKMTGRIPLLPLAEQEQLYELLEVEYDSFLRQMEAAGENALEAKTYDLKAKTLESSEVVPAKADPSSPFGAPVYIEKVSAVRLGKPFPSREVVRRVAESLGHDVEITDENAARVLADIQKRYDQSLLGTWQTVLNHFDDYRRRVLDDLPDASRQSKERDRLDAIASRWKEVIGILPIGERVTFKTATGNLTGIILKIEQKGQPKNPLALSSWKVTAAIADATRQITIPVSRLWPTGKADSEDVFAVEVEPIPPWLEKPEQTLERFDKLQSEAREDRYIATGNLLAAYDWLNNRGRIINYTDDAGAIRQGILTPSDFDLDAYAATKATAIGSPREVVDWLTAHRGNTLWARDQVVRLTLGKDGKLTVVTDSTKKTGGVYYLDRALTDLTGDFIKSGGSMRAHAWREHEKIVARLQQLGAIFEARKEPSQMQTGAMYSIRPGSSSLKGVSIDAGNLTKALGLPDGPFWANYEFLASKHPEYFKSPDDARTHVEQVLSRPDVAIPRQNGFIDLVASNGTDRLIGFRAIRRGGRYNISTAYILDPGQLERMKQGAARAGGTVLELQVPSVIDPAGRDGEYTRLAQTEQGLGRLHPEHRARIERALTAVVQRIAGPSASVRFVDIHELAAPPRGWGSLGEEAVTARGSYLPAQDLITIALADPRHPLPGTLDTAFHEAFHAVENRLLTEQEMQVLRREEPRLRDIVQRAFRFSDDEIGSIADFEVRAMAFEAYAAARARGQQVTGIHIGIRRAFERLFDLFSRIANALRGLGFQTANDVFARVYDGGVADRPKSGPGAQEPRFNIRPDLKDPIRPRGNLNNFRSFDPLPENWRDWWKQPDLKWSDRVWGMIDAAFLPANRALGDRYVDMRRMQAAVEVTGKQINEGIDMALGATLFEGRVEKRLKDYWLKTWKPVLDRAARNGISREDLHAYLYARHAPERNAHIAEINPAMPDGGSGMTNAEAQEVMARFAQEEKRVALEDAAREIDNIVRRIRSMMVSDQLEHETTIQSWEHAYQHYVPLQGFEAGDETIAVAGGAGRSSGFDVRGPETKRALGRSSKADDILTNLFLMGERTIIRGEQNRVGRAAMRFMQSNPQPDLYAVQRSERVLTDGRPGTITESDIDLLLGERPVTVERVNRDTGLVETVTKIASPFAKDSFAVKVGGHTYYIQIKHPGLLQALKNVGVQRLPALVQAHAWLTRQFSAFRTARNPDWFISNLFRDVQDAAYTLSAEQRDQLVKNFAKNIGSLRTYVGAVMGEMMQGEGRIGTWARRSLADKKAAKLYEDWKRNGGQIAFMGLHDLDGARREIEAAFKATKESSFRTALMAGPRVGKNILKGIEFFNGAIEAGTRLAVYDAALKAGMTKAKAAELSKESTTNFNRKGVYSPFLNSFYAFFNARVQGATKIIRLLRRSKMARRVAIGLVFGGFAATLWNLSASGDDDDKKNRYAQRKYWERERYFIFYMPGSTEPIRFPMGYGLQLFWMLGENIAMLSQGQITPAKAAINYLSTMVNAFSPISAEGSPSDPGTWLRLIMPSVEMPLLELTTNENWRRKPIHPKFGGVGEPHSEQYFTTTSPAAIDVAQFLNRVSGGNAFTPGKVDLYPGDIQYLWEFAGGGLGQTAGRTDTMIRNWINGIPTPANQIPIVRHFRGMDTKQSAAEGYYEDQREVQEGMARVRRALKEEDPAKAGDARTTVEKGYERFDIRPGKRKGSISSEAEAVFRDAQKELKDLRSQESQVRADAKMTRKEKADLIEIIRDNMRQVQNEARRAYREMHAR